MTFEPVAQDRYASVNGLRLHYLDWGGGDAPVLLLLHGAFWNARVWDALAPDLVGPYRVLALDQRGHGSSEWADDYGWMRLVEDLEQFQSSLALNRFSIVGHSMGGMMAYMFAGRHPDAVERLIVLDMGPEQRTPTLVQIQAQAAMLIDVPFAGPEDALSAIREAVPLADERLLANAVAGNLKAESDGTWRWRYDTRRRSTGRRQRRPEPDEQWEALRAITCPVLLLRGETGILPAEIARRMVQEMQHCRLVDVAGSGHNPHLERPGEVRGLIHDFLLDGERGKAATPPASPAFLDPRTASGGTADPV
jgi:esterase